MAALPADPSFSCAHATASQDQAICSDQALSALDGRLAQLYRERRALLSPQGAKLLQDSQREWLRFITVVCPPTPPAIPAGRDQKGCLKRQYTERLADLHQAAQRIGPYLFNNVSHYAAQPAQDATGALTGFVVQTVSFPQIDNADSAERVAWNLKNLRTLPRETDCGDGGDEAIGYEIGYANARLISVAWSDWTYCHGTAHGFGDVTVENTVLSPHLRPLVAQDVFGPGTSWVAPLQDRFWAALLQSGWKPPENQAEDIKSQLEAKFIDPEQWLFTADGLNISFSAYEGGRYTCTPQPLTLHWSELKPLFTNGSVVP